LYDAATVITFRLFGEVGICVYLLRKSRSVDERFHQLVDVIHRMIV